MLQSKYEYTNHFYKWPVPKNSGYFNILRIHFYIIAGIDGEIETHIGKASLIFVTLYHNLWSTNDASFKIKIDIYKSVVLSSMVLNSKHFIANI